jgi:hypothetical protein
LTSHEISVVPVEGCVGCSGVDEEEIEDKDKDILGRGEEGEGIVFRVLKKAWYCCKKVTTSVVCLSNMSMNI